MWAGREAAQQSGMQVGLLDPVAALVDVVLDL